MNPFVQQIRNLGPARLAAMGGVAVGLIAFIIFFATRFSAAPMALLYGNLSATDSREVIRQLELSGVPFEMGNNNTEIRIPTEQVTTTRMHMAELGLPSGASVGYEIFDNMDALGATNFMQNVNLVRALEGELGRTIKSIEGIQNARVHLVMPTREMFTREMQEPTASVYIKMKSGRLAENQVKAVQHLIASAVPKLKPTNISIVDERGTLLSRSFENDQQQVQAQQEEARNNLERRLATSITTLVESTLGPGKVRAEVRADMEFDKVVTASESYNPDQSVPRSTVTVNNNAKSSDRQPRDVSVSQNLPDAQANSGAGTATTDENRTEETVNYEISKTTENRVRESGNVKRLSVAVLVDGSYTPPAEEGGKRAYQALPEETMTKIEALVKTAIGFDQARGDQVQVTNMQFTGIDDLLGDQKEFNVLGFNKEEIMRTAEGLGVAVVAVLVILLVVRPLVTRAFEAMPTGEDAILSNETNSAQLTGPGGAPIPSNTDDEDELDDLIDIDKVEGRVKKSSLRKISDIIEKHPDEALSIIRTWLYQEA